MIGSLTKIREICFENGRWQTGPGTCPIASSCINKQNYCWCFISFKTNLIIRTLSASELPQNSFVKHNMGIYVRMPRLFIVFWQGQQNILLHSQESFNFLLINSSSLNHIDFAFSFTYSCIPPRKFFPQSISILSYLISILYNYPLFPCSVVMPLYVLPRLLVWPKTTHYLV